MVLGDEAGILEDDDRVTLNIIEYSDPIYAKILYYKKCIDQHNVELLDICNQTVVMAVGATGTGKSTFMNAIIQGSEMMTYDDNCNIITTNNLMY